MIPSLKKRKTKAAALRELMTTGPRAWGWFTQQELIAAGGLRYGGRLHEIRRGDDGELPLAVDCIALDSEGGRYSYRLRPYEQMETQPAIKIGNSKDATIARLEARVLQLEAAFDRLLARVADGLEVHGPAVVERKPRSIDEQLRMFDYVRTAAERLR